MKATDGAKSHALGSRCHALLLVPSGRPRGSVLTLISWLGAGCWVPGTTFVCGGCSLCGPATGTPAAPPGATPVVSPLHYSAASASHTPQDQMAAGDVLLSPLAGSHRGFSSSSLRSCDSWVLGAAGPLLPPAAPWQSWHRGANSRKELIKPMCN